MTRIPAWLSALALVGVMILGSWYLVAGVLRIDPTHRRHHATVELHDAAGLRAGSEVVYRGVNIGRVDEVRNVPGTVRMRISYDAKYRIPVHSTMRVESLSALGEPVFAFLPESNAGPWLADGAHLTETVTLPTSVPDLLATVSGLLDQTDTESVRRLVDAFSQSVTVLEATMPAARRGAELLLTTLSAHEGSLEVVLRDLVRMMRDVDWARPAMTAAPPMLDEFGENLGISYKYLFQGSSVLRGNEILGSWRHQEGELAEFLAQLAPEIGAIGVALRPATRATGPLLGSIDIGTLLEQAIATLPGDSVRFTVTVPR
ncbi:MULTISPECIES: MlaD family protein [Nocardia]|uniref:MlaD family protein n=1 Tax=Nocardia TaxID=1817 RepID=UPI0007EA359E|nr:MULTISPECIES: MlaD family protein [Nocardia]MBF6277452.1 MCE family protein [Nocardia nova]OBA43897.1 Mce family protein [Nocardia sp. 852002-51101_SCH5132738]OBB48022.1 Mce family protein [Nocardia sp. 852002-51244_SCH5132740]OBF71710.1 Mce family protein [Mycobacterium sp. 852002-51759_SCH5129042]